MQLICGNFSLKQHQEAVKRVQPKTTNFIAQGYKPTMDDIVNSETGVLYSWKNVPLAFWAIPTLNNMVFSKQLWEDVRNNEFISAAIENNCFWGEDEHRDDSEVKLQNVAIRVNDFHCIDNNLVVGDVDLMATPRGLAVYPLALSGTIGSSSRGYGELKDRGDGLQDVVSEGYLAVDWDLVGFPAVPNALVLTTRDKEIDAAVQATTKLGKIEENLRNLVKDSYEQCPESEILCKMYELFNSIKPYNGKVFDMSSKRFPSPSSIKFKKR